MSVPLYKYHILVYSSALCVSKEIKEDWERLREKLQGWCKYGTTSLQGTIKQIRRPQGLL